MRHAIPKEGDTGLASPFRFAGERTCRRDRSSRRYRGARRSKVVASTPGATAKDIAWLKLDVISRRGSGMLSNVTTVQRINTVGGQLDDACDRGGDGRSMPYTADYVFLRKG